MLAYSLQKKLLSIYLITHFLPNCVFHAPKQLSWQKIKDTLSNESMATPKKQYISFSSFHLVSPMKIEMALPSTVQKIEKRNRFSIRKMSCIRKVTERKLKAMNENRNIFILK